MRTDRRKSTRTRSRRKSTRMKSRRKSTRVKSRRKKIKKSRRYSRTIDAKSVNAKDDKKDIVGAKDGKKKKMSTGKKVGLAVGGTLAGLTGVTIGGSVITYKMVMNSPQAKELAKIADAAPGSKAEANAIREHLLQEKARLGEALKGESMYAKKEALVLDNFKSSVLKQDQIIARRSEALAKGDTEGAAKLTTLLEQAEESLTRNMDVLGKIRTDEELKQYVTTRSQAIDGKLEKLGQADNVVTEEAEHAIEKSDGGDVGALGGDKAVEAGGDKAFEAATLAGEEGAGVVGETMAKTGGESLLTHLIF